MLKYLLDIFLIIVLICLIVINLFLEFIAILLAFQDNNNSCKYLVKKITLILLPLPLIFNLFLSYILFLLNSNNSLTLTPVKNKKEKIIQFLFSILLLNIIEFLTFLYSRREITFLFNCWTLGNLISLHWLINFHFFSNLKIEINDE